MKNKILAPLFFVATLSSQAQALIGANIPVKQGQNVATNPTTVDNIKDLLSKLMNNSEGRLNAINSLKAIKFEEHKPQLLIDFVPQVLECYLATDDFFISYELARYLSDLCSKYFHAEQELYALINGSQEFKDRLLQEANGNTSLCDMTIVGSVKKNEELLRLCLPHLLYLFRQAKSTPRLVALMALSTFPKELYEGLLPETRAALVYALEEFMESKLPVRTEHEAKVLKDRATVVRNWVNGEEDSTLISRLGRTLSLEEKIKQFLESEDGVDQDSKALALIDAEWSKKDDAGLTALGVDAVLEKMLQRPKTLKHMGSIARKHLNMRMRILQKAASLLPLLHSENPEMIENAWSIFSVITERHCSGGCCEY